MTIDKIKEAVEEIRKKRWDDWDDEASYIMEHDLYISLLEAIQNGRCENPAEAAAEALKAGPARESRFA